jgi:hypothetical protein
MPDRYDLTHLNTQFGPHTSSRVRLARLEEQTAELAAEYCHLREGYHRLAVEIEREAVALERLRRNQRRVVLCLCAFGALWLRWLIG